MKTFLWGKSYVPLCLGMFELRWLELFIKAQLIMATEVAVVKEEKKKEKKIKNNN